MFQTGFLPIIRSLALYTQQQVYVIQVMLCVQCYTHDDGQRNCPKHVEFYSKNKFEKLVHLVCFIIRIYHDARSSECQITYLLICLLARTEQVKHVSYVL
jgi:hypothetical protein